MAQQTIYGSSMQLCKLLPPAAKQNARLLGCQLHISARRGHRHTASELTVAHCRVWHLVNRNGNRDSNMKTPKAINCDTEQGEDGADCGNKKKS